MNDSIKKAKPFGIVAIVLAGVYILLEAGYYIAELVKWDIGYIPTIINDISNILFYGIVFSALIIVSICIKNKKLVAFSFIGTIMGLFVGAIVEIVRAIQNIKWNGSLSYSDVHWVLNNLQSIIYNAAYIMLFLFLASKLADKKQPLPTQQDKSANGLGIIAIVLVAFSMIADVVLTIIGDINFIIYSSPVLRYASLGVTTIVTIAVFVLTVLLKKKWIPIILYGVNVFISTVTNIYYFVSQYEDYYSNDVYFVIREIISICQIIVFGVMMIMVVLWLAKMPDIPKKVKQQPVPMPPMPQPVYQQIPTQQYAPQYPQQPVQPVASAQAQPPQSQLVVPQPQQTQPQQAYQQYPPNQYPPQ